MMRCTPSQAEDILALLTASFAGMDARIDPPSSLNRMGTSDIVAQMTQGEIWADSAALHACVFLTPRGGHLYIGKLAVHPDHRRQGLASRLLDHAVTRARTLGFEAVALQTRVELTENHRLFAARGFKVVGQTSHAGFDRPTSLTFRRALSP